MRWLALLLVPAVAFAGRPALHERSVRHDVPVGLGADDLAAAYGIPVDADPGATVALIEAYGYPQLDTDLAFYRLAYGLPPCSVENGCLTVVDQRGGHALPPLPPPTSDDWPLETALDVDMVSAGCPRCRILVVQADSEDNANLAAANDTAAALGATTISNSWGGPENAAANPHYDHPGIATFASSGDVGEVDVPTYPASAPSVIAVGGTTLQPSLATARGWDEGAWDDGGSGCSKITPRPTWQPESSCAMRHVPDIAAVADGPLGIAVAHGRAWTSVSGTSAATPLVAAIFAVTAHGSSTVPDLYAHPEQFHDIQFGSDGACKDCTAISGWDGPTGLGSPNAAALGGATAPILRLDPPNGAKVNEGFTVTVDCTPTDGAQIDRVLITVDNKLLATMTQPPYAKSTSARAFGAGGHHVIVSCATTAGMTADAVANIRVCLSDGNCPDPPSALPNGDCNAGGSPTWLVLLLLARRRSRARG